MNRKAKVSLEFLTLEPLAKTGFGTDVIEALTANVADFATPDVPVATLTTVNDTFKLKISAANDGSQTKIDERIAYELIWNTTYKDEAMYVERIAKGNVVLYDKSGFKHTKTETTSAEIPLQPFVTGKTGKVTGSAVITIAKGSGAKSFLVFWINAADPGPSSLKVVNGIVEIIAPSKMCLFPATKLKYTIIGLTPGEHYNIGVIGFNSKGVSPLSNGVEIVAQF